MPLEICKFANNRIKICKRDLENTGLKDFVLHKTENIQQHNLAISQYSFTEIKRRNQIETNIK
jgi:hypothetical protein